jgi:hypothetical protein
MNRSHRSLFRLILALGLFFTISGYARAQERKSAPSKEEIAALREKALKLIDSVAGQLGTLQSAENRARMGANIFDSLWKHDEERARALMRVVQEDIKTELQKRDDGDVERRYDVRFNVFLKLRTDTIERIAKYDGQAAYDFLKVTEPVFENQEPYEFRENEQTLELRLAKQIASNNPDVALKLARQSLKQSLDSSVLRVLSRLNRKHKEHANLLYKEIVGKLPDANLGEAWHTREFVQTLVRNYEPPDVDASTHRELIELVVTSALERGCGKKPPKEEDEDEGGEFCKWAATILANSEKYDSRIARIKAWSISGMEPWDFALVYEEVQELLQERAYDEVEALAVKYPQAREGLYSQAIFHAMSVGETDKMQKLMDRFAGHDPEKRQILAAQIENHQKRNGLSEEKLTEIQSQLEVIRDNRTRAFYLMGMASQVAATNQKAGMKFLDQARELIDTLKPGKDQTQARLSLALVYCQQKNDRGFTIMESLLPKLNELVEVAAKLDGYDTSYLRDGEWNMSANGSVGEILTMLSESAGAFAWIDFDRAVTLSSQFERPEIRMMAHLKLAQSILAGPSQTSGITTRHLDYFSFH